jgi:DNA-binding transcriptional LysR family regulator
MSMRVEQLEYVAAVATLGSFAAASEQLHLSQPALSETIRKLETELGVRIFERGRTGTTLSADGREVLPRIFDAIEAMDRLREATRGEQGARRMVQVGTVSAASTPLLSPAIRRFTASHPGGQVAVSTLQMREIGAHIKDGTLDLGLSNYFADESVPEELESTTLLHGHPVVCLRSDDPLSAKERLDLDDLLDVPIVTMRTGYLMPRYLSRLFGEFAPKIHCAADGADMGKMMVAGGLGVTVLPSYSVVGDPLTETGVLTYRQLDDDVRFKLVLHRRPDPLRTRTAGVVADLHRLLVELAADLDGDPEMGMLDPVIG